MRGTFDHPRHAACRLQHRGLPSVMNAGHGADNPDAELERLRRQYPQWRIWRGRATREYWALPPPDHLAVRDLISATGIGELARRLAQVEGRNGL